MIERHWTGVAKPGEAIHYIEHLQKETFPQLKTLPGFVKASILHRMVEKGVEFLVITVWDSMEDIKRFSGDCVETAVVPEKAQKMMIEFDRTARHYEVVH